MKRFLLASFISCAVVIFFFSLGSFAEDKIDLNKATVSQIAKIPGIGEVTAEKIVTHRKKLGKITSIDQLLQVEGVGEKTVEKIADYVLIDGKDVVLKPASSAKPRPNPSGKININKATAKELEVLPGIGKVTAEKIVEYRKENGPFKKASDLKKVKGIGDKTYAKMANQIVVE